jgi:hypothetical protein
MATANLFTAAASSVHHDSMIDAEPTPESHGLQPLLGSMAWEGNQFSNENEFIFQLSSEDSAEVDAALAAFKGSCNLRLAHLR